MEHLEFKERLPELGFKKLTVFFNLLLLVLSGAENVLGALPEEANSFKKPKPVQEFVLPENIIASVRGRFQDLFPNEFDYSDLSKNHTREKIINFFGYSPEISEIELKKSLEMYLASRRQIILNKLAFIFDVNDELDKLSNMNLVYLIQGIVKREKKNCLFESFLKKQFQQIIINNSGINDMELRKKADEISEKIKNFKEEGNKFLEIFFLIDSYLH